jgi:cob(I)alamin adenosyltransferase
MTRASSGLAAAADQAAAAAAPRHDRPGCVHVYTGQGKGKTSAAMGLALRSAGHHRRVHIGQFMKVGERGEVEALGRIGGVDVEQYGPGGRLGSGPGGDHERCARDGLTRSSAALRGGDYDVVILDEIDVAISCGLLSVEDCLDLLDQRPPHVELVLTGRSAPAELIERADLVTEMREIKHYFRRGVTARPGVEY